MPFHLFQRFDTINGRQNQETFAFKKTTKHGYNIGFIIGD
jgi:hypothetical protein